MKTISSVKIKKRFSIIIERIEKNKVFIIHKRKYLQLKKYFIKKIFPILKDPLFINYWDKGFYYSRDNRFKSIRKPSGPIMKRIYSYQGRGHMLSQDFQLNIMPTKYGGNKPDGFKITLEPENEDLSKVITDAFSKREYNYNTIESSVLDFVDEVVGHLVSYAEVLYEVVTVKENEELKELKLKLINNAQITRTPFGYFQFVSWRQAKKNNMKVQLVFLPKSKIFRITFPEKLGGIRAHNRIWGKVHNLNKKLSPDFFDDVIKKKIDIDFDYQKYNKDKDIATAKATKELGWNGRGSFDKYFLEYYTYFRYLNKIKSKIFLREHIVKSINEFLTSKNVNIKSKIVVEGLVKEKDVSEQYEKLKSGNIVFDDLFKFVLKHM